MPSDPTSFAAASRVKTSRSRGAVSASTDHAPVSGPSSLELFASSSPDSSSSRTSPRSRHAVSTVSYETLPRSGSMRNGRCVGLPTSAPRTVESDSSCWPIPTASEYGSSQNGINGVGGENERPSAGTPSLWTLARNWPTPCSSDGKRGLKDEAFREGGPTLSKAVGKNLWPTPTAGDGSGSGSGSRNQEGSKAHAGVSLTDAVTTGTSTASRRARAKSTDGMVLNPLFVEAMQGFPPGWTEGGVRRTGHQTGFDFSETP